MSIIPVIYIVFQTAFVLKYVSLDSINEWWSVVIKYDVSLLDIVFLNNEKEAEIEYFFLIDTDIWNGFVIDRQVHKLI